MTHFTYKKNQLHAEQVAIKSIAQKVGTPVYVYSLAALTEQFQTFDRAFSQFPHLICYSMKCNSNLAILKAISNLGGGVDIVSGGELYRALKAGIDPQKIVFAGVGKTQAEMIAALKAGILFFNVESEAELMALNAASSKLKKRAPVCLRVNPNIDPKTHPYITTGLKKSKFGVDVKQSIALYKAAQNLKNIEIVGVDCHIGSQLTQVKPFVDSVKKVREMISQLKKAGIEIRYLDLGGGLGIRYKSETPPSPENYAAALIRELKELDVTLVFEPGRFIMGNSGVLITQMIYEKKTPSKKFKIVDAAMNDLIRPALYESYHEIGPVQTSGKKAEKVNVVGPICESGDFFAEDRLLEDVQPGQLLSIFSAGAYGFSMSSNYNSRPRVAEVLVSGKNFEVIRERESLEDLVRGEKIPDFLQSPNSHASQIKRGKR